MASARSPACSPASSCAGPTTSCTPPPPRTGRAGASAGSGFVPDSHRLHRPPEPGDDAIAVPMEAPARLRRVAGVVPAIVPAQDADRAWWDRTTDVGHGGEHDVP